ncbi:MAG: hypothetical protein GY827_08990 [Cytophagales bacterium]|nr:hypothetical protein [Cytophagales bacterium]
MFKILLILTLSVFSSIISAQNSICNMKKIQADNNLLLDEITLDKNKLSNINDLSVLFYQYEDGTVPSYYHSFNVDDSTIIYKKMNETFLSVDSLRLALSKKELSNLLTHLKILKSHYYFNECEIDGGINESILIKDNGGFISALLSKGQVADKDRVGSITIL